MIPASAPITHELALLDLRHMLYAAQHARSVMKENGWAEDEVGLRVMEDLEPWLWGDRCIVNPLNELIQRCEANGGKVAYIDYFNFLIIAKRTPQLRIGVLLLANRELPEPDISRILPALT